MPTATGVTGSLHHTTLADNFLSRDVIVRQFTLQSSLAQFGGTGGQDTAGLG